jgi:secreted trypsin-like serine protease
MINGRPALEGEVPYMAGIVVDHSRFCGGALISSTVVLTSASCIEGYYK